MKAPTKGRLGHEFLATSKGRESVHLVRAGDRRRNRPFATIRRFAGNRVMVAFAPDWLSPEIAVVTKADLPCGRKFAAKCRSCRGNVLLISAVTGQGLNESSCIAILLNREAW